MAAPWVETYRLRGGNIITRSPSYVTKGAKSERLVFLHMLAEKVLPKQNYWVVLFHDFCVGRCTRDPIIALKHEKKADFHDMSLLNKFLKIISMQSQKVFFIFIILICEL